jgi:hypothetical protein
MALPGDVVSVTVRGLAGDLLCGPVSFERASLVAELRRLVRTKHPTSGRIQVGLCLGDALLQDEDSVHGEDIECTAAFQLKPRLLAKARARCIVNLGNGKQEVRQRFASLPQAAREDPDILSAAILRCPEVAHDVDCVLWSDRDFFLEAPPWMLRFASAEVQSDYEVVLRAVQQDGDLLQLVDEKLRSDRGLVLEAVRQNGAAIQHADEHLRRDCEVARAAARVGGLKWVDSAIQSERDTVLAAVTHAGHELQHASRQLRGDPEIVGQAVLGKGRAWCLAYVHYTPALRAIVMQAVRDDFSGFYFADRAMQGDRGIAMEAL